MSLLMTPSHLGREGRGKEEEDEEEEEGFATMEEERAFPSDLSGFEFFMIMLSNSLKKLVRIYIHTLVAQLLDLFTFWGSTP